MAIKKPKSKSLNNGNIKKKRSKRKANWLLRFTLAIIIVPALILAWVLLTSLDTKGEPVTGARFDKQLDPAITEQNIKDLKSRIVYSEAEKVEINLKSATLRINIDTIDTATDEQIQAILNDAYAKVNEVLPIDTYFKNKDNVKMYDVEVNVYNYIPTDENRAGFICHILTKNASTNEVDHSTPSSPRNQETTDEVKNSPKVGDKVGQ